MYTQSSITYNTDIKIRLFFKKEVKMEGEVTLINLVSLNQLDQVKKLVSRGCDVNQSDQTGTTALHMAASNNSVEMVAFLLNSGAEPLCFNDVGQTPRSIAQSYQNKELIDILIAAEEKTTKKHKKPK